MKTKVKFLIEKPVDEFTGQYEQIIGGEVFAYFPEEKYSNVVSEMRTCYAHIGQHSACHPSYAESCKEASPEQYADLKNELEGLGYELVILNGWRISPTNYKRKDGRNFYTKEVGSLKHEIVEKADGTAYVSSTDSENEYSGTMPIDISDDLPSLEDALLYVNRKTFEKLLIKDTINQQVMDFFRNREERGL